MHATAEPDPPPPPDFAAVYRAHFNFVWRTLGRMGVRDAELEDAAQEAFMVVHRRLDSYDPNRPLRPWLAGIAVRVALAERRRARHRRETLSEQPAAGRPHGDPTPDGLLAQRQRAGRVRAALGALIPEQRAVFVMVEMEEIACPEIAEALGISVNTVYSRLRLARRAFAAEIRRLRAKEGVA